MTKLRPALIRRIREELQDIALRHGGRPGPEDVFRFPPSLGETARKTAEAAAAMHAYLRQNDRELFGITVLVASEDDLRDDDENGGFHGLLLRVPDEDGLWVSPEVFGELQDYVVGSPEDDLIRISGLREAGPRLEERLPELLVRADRLPVVRQALERLERDDSDRSVLLLRGRPGSGKRATLRKALEVLYPDDGGSPLVIPFASDAEDPMEPFIRALGPSLATVAEYLDDEETRWWEDEGSALLERSRKGRIWDLARDQGPVDLIQAFALYLKAHLERRHRAGRPAYVLVDGFVPESEAVSWLRSLLSEFLGRQSFRLIIIRDSDDFDEALPLPGKGHEVTFRRPADEDWSELIRSASLGPPLSEDDVASLAESCGASLYRLFHGLLARERSLDGSADPAEALVLSLDAGTRRTLFLAHAASGLANRRLLAERLGPQDETRMHEEARYDGLVDYGLIREDPDGRVRPLPGGPANAARPDLEGLREAERFGSFLADRLDAGEPVDLYRLFRYLERWGPADRAVAVLDRLLDSLLTNRRLRAAGLLLNGPPMALSDLDGPDMEALQNVVGAARLRYVLLTGTVDQVRDLARDGTVTLISGRGAYSDRFRLHNARYSYAVGRWDEALGAAKDALFTFQKSGDHAGETHSHLELALALLASGKVRDALEHFGIARRIGTQVNAVWGVLRASALETVSQFLFGNLPRALRECREYREKAHHEGRRDVWLLLTLAALRIQWELGRYGRAADLAEEGRRTAAFYGLTDEQRVMELWKGRALLADGGDENRSEGRRLLSGAAEPGRPGAREAFAFLAEDAWFGGDAKRARRYIDSAAEEVRISSRLQGEGDDWSDGYVPLEGRLADGRGALDVLGERIRAFGAFLAVQAGEVGRLDDLAALLEKDGRRVAGPFSYQYALWAALATPDEDRESQTRHMSRAFNDLQARAGRFDDNQAKHAWLNANPWNRRLMEEAQRRKFL